MMSVGASFILGMVVGGGISVVFAWFTLYKTAKRQVDQLAKENEELRSRVKDWEDKEASRGHNCSVMGDELLATIADLEHAAW